MGIRNTASFLADGNELFWVLLKRTIGFLYPVNTIFGFIANKKTTSLVFKATKGRFHK